MQQIETDYLVVGSGASGLAFADTLLEQSDAHITIVDRHAAPGGHWNDAYPFVALHQPSSFYGVNSLELGSRRKDSAGINQGLYELASGPEITGYFHKVMAQKLLPSGRVRYHPLCTDLGTTTAGHSEFESILTGQKTQVLVRKKRVDANFYGPRVPATRAPRYQVAEGVRLVPPGALVQLWQAQHLRPAHFAIVGAGKTAMDVGVWLLGCGVQPESISSVMPRDSWLVNRITTQPGMEFFDQSIGGQVAQMDALAKATDETDLFSRLEASAQMLRIDPDRQPGMFHYATISEGEVAVLRRIRNVIRMGHVQAVEPEALVLDGGRVPMPRGTLYVDCSASAVEKRPIQPIFQGHQVVLQLVRAPLPTFSAALVAYVEAHYGASDPGDTHKNRLCATVPFPESPLGFARATMVSMVNQMQWGQDKALRAWIRESRLDGFAKVIADVAPQDTEKLALLGQLRANIAAAMGNIPKLLATEQTRHLATATATASG